MSHFSLVPLADKPELIDQCIDLLNEEWPRSRESRMIGLKRLLCLSPPMAYVLIEADSGNLVGHLRLNPLGLGHVRECWIESVVIRKAMRGKGIGRKMMEMVETEARKHGFDKICCSTTDKIDFYHRCGYQPSDRPIQNCGSSAPLLERFGITSLLMRNNGLTMSSKNGAVSREIQTKSQSGPITNVPVPPAPPLVYSNSHQNTEKKYMFKHLE